jgi:hypothetical protein
MGGCPDEGIHIAGIVGGRVCRARSEHQEETEGWKGEVAKHGKVEFGDSKTSFEF